MLNHFLPGFITLGVCLFLTTAYTRHENAPQATPDNANWQAFELSDLIRRRAESDRPYLPFLDKPSMSMGLYELKAGGKDEQTPHGRTAKFRMGKDEIDVGPGSIMWVKEGIGHHFHDLSDDSDVLILFEKRR